MINVFQPSFDDVEIDALRQLFLTNWIGRGSANSEFINQFSRFVGCKSLNLLTTNSCTESLFTICEHLKIGPGDDVIMSTISFIGAYNAAASTGANVTLVDVCLPTLQPSLYQIQNEISDCTRLILLTPYNIPSAEIQAIHDYAISRGITLVLDLACSPFSSINGVNPCVYSDYSCWSFDAMKILCTGDGSAIYCMDPQRIPDLAARIYMGLSSEAGFTSTSDQEWWLFDSSGPYRRSIMNDISATLGLTQLTKVPSFIESRKQVSEIYTSILQDCDVMVLPQEMVANGHNIKGSYYFYSVLFKSRDQRNRVASVLRQSSIYCTFRYQPLHTVPSISSSPTKYSTLAAADKISKTMLNLPLHQSISNDEATAIAHLIKDTILC